MKFILRVKNDWHEWDEEYDKENVRDPEEWAKQTVDRFNATLGKRERPRTLIKTTIIGVGSKEHQWVKRTDGMSVSFRGAYVDLMYCSRCGITGKRYGLSGFVKRDSKYRAKKYQECQTAERPKEQA